ARRLYCGGCLAEKRLQRLPSFGGRLRALDFRPEELRLFELPSKQRPVSIGQSGHVLVYQLCRVGQVRKLRSTDEFIEFTDHTANHLNAAGIRVALKVARDSQLEVEGLQ